MTQPIHSREIPDHGPQVLGVSISLVTISGVAVGARILARRSSMAGKRTSSDDWLIIIAWFFALARSIVDSISVIKHGYGKHSADLSVRDSHRANLLIWVSGLFYRLSALNIKLSVLFLYLRLFTLHGIHPRFRLLVLLSIYTVLLVFGAFIVLGIFGCWPVDRFWNKSKTGWCINFLAFYYVHTGMEVCFDVWVMLLPLGVIAELNLPRKTKWSLAVIFGLGLLSTAANIPVIQALFQASQHTDMSWTTTDAKTWTSVELNLAIICTCLPILRNPLRIFAHRTFGTAVNNTGSATIGSNHHRLDPWDGVESSNWTRRNTIKMESSSHLQLDAWEGENGTTSSSDNNRTSLLELDKVAVSDFVGSRGRERG